MADCPKCKSAMLANGDILTCINCGFQRSIAKRAKSYSELLEDNETLKGRIRELEGEDATRVYTVSNVP